MLSNSFRTIPSGFSAVVAYSNITRILNAQILTDLQDVGFENLAVSWQIFRIFIDYSDFAIVILPVSCSLHRIFLLATTTDEDFSICLGYSNRAKWIRQQVPQTTFRTKLNILTLLFTSSIEKLRKDCDLLRFISPLARKPSEVNCHR